MTEPVSQSEFARIIGVNSRSYITKLKADGRLVMAGDRVSVEESIQRILETADPNRDDVVARWARGRRQASRPTPPEEKEEVKGESTFVIARSRKEQAMADMSEMERDRKRGQLLGKNAVETAFKDVLTTLRQSLEQYPNRVAPMLVGQDLNTIRALLKKEINTSLKELVENFEKAKQDIVNEGVEP